MNCYCLFQAIVLLLCLSLSTTAGPTEVSVVVINDNKLPALNNTDVEKSLRHAEKLMAAVCGRDIQMQLSEKRFSTREFIAGQEQALLPLRFKYELDPRPFVVDEKHFATKLKPLIKKRLVPERDYAAVKAFQSVDAKDVELAADRVARRYSASLNILLNITLPNERRLVDETNWMDYSAEKWELLLSINQRSAKPTIYLTNALCFISKPADTPIADIANGALVSSVVLPASNTVFICYGVCMNDNAWTNYTATAPLRPDDRAVAISVILAQSLGVKLLNRLDFSYDKTKGGLALPIPLLAKHEGWLRDMERLTIQERPQTLLAKSQIEGELYKVDLRIQIARAQGNWNVVGREAEYVVFELADRFELSQDILDRYSALGMEAEGHLK